MNKIHKLFFILAIGIFFTSCNKDDSPYVAPPRDYAEQYVTDLATIDKYLDEYYMEVSVDYEVTLTKIPSPNTENKVSIRAEYGADLLEKTVTRNEVDYKVYYIKFREGANENPTAVDSVYVAYRGKSIYHQSDEVPGSNPKTYVDNIYDTQFDYAPQPLWFTLQSTISGWGDIIPEFKTGNYDSSGSPSNPASFMDYGAGIMFLPSGLAYFNGIQPGIPQYSPLIFSFKLIDQRYRDHDRDGILSKDEVDPAVANQNPIDYDSDGDTFANMYDMDDDGDNYLTKNETKRPNIIDNNGDSVSNGYYPYNGAAVDDPTTPNIDERQGIPSRSGVAPNYIYDYTTPSRVRKHVDPSWH